MSEADSAIAESDLDVIIAQMLPDVKIQAFWIHR